MLKYTRELTVRQWSIVGKDFSKGPDKAVGPRSHVSLPLKITNFLGEIARDR